MIWLFLYPVFFAPHFAYVGRYSTTGTVWPGVYSSAIATVLMISLGKSHSYPSHAGLTVWSGFTLMDTDDPFDQTVLGSLDCQSILTAPTHYMWDTPQKTRKRVKEETHMDLVISEVGSQTPLNHSPVSPVSFITSILSHQFRKANSYSIDRGEITQTRSVNTSHVNGLFCPLRNKWRI